MEQHEVKGSFILGNRFERHTEDVPYFSKVNRKETALLEGSDSNFA
jgi:hypothetical protein